MDELNPYQPPQAAAPSEFGEDSTVDLAAEFYSARGLYRNGSHLLVDKKKHVFPRVCIICGQVTERFPGPRTVRWAPWFIGILAVFCGGFLLAL